MDFESTNLHWSCEHHSCNRNLGNCVLFHTSHLLGRQCRGNGLESPWNVLLSYFKTLSFGPARGWTCCLARTADRRPTNWAWWAAIKTTLHKNSNPGPMAWGAPALSPGHDNLCWGLTGSVPLGLEIALSEEKVLFRDWSKSIGGGGPEQRGGGSWGFEPCARGGSGNFQLPLGGGSPYFIT